MTAINISVSGTVTLTCTAKPEYPGTLVLCLAIASPGSFNTTKILTHVVSSFTSTRTINTFQIEFWFAPSGATECNRFNAITVRTADTGSNSWTIAYDYSSTFRNKYSTGTYYTYWYWADQGNNLVTNEPPSGTLISDTGFCNAYNQYKFTTPEMYVKRAVVINMTGIYYAGDTTYDGMYSPNFTDGIRIKYNGVVYTTYAAAIAAGFHFAWINSSSHTSGFLADYLSKTDSTTDTTSPITVNSKTFTLTTNNFSNYFVAASPIAGDNNQFIFGGALAPFAKTLSDSYYLNQSCLRIIFPI